MALGSAGVSQVTANQHPVVQPTSAINDCGKVIDVKTGREASGAYPFR